MNSKIKAILIVSCIVAIFVGATVAYAATVYVPTDNNLSHLDPLPTPDPSTTSTPIEPQVIGGTITGNDTDTEGNYIFHKGDTLHIIVQTNSTIAGREVQLWNNGKYVISAYTDATGKAEFDRVVNNPYDYVGKIANEQPDT